MSKFVQDKAVVVTGAGGGIGREFARAFASHGARVVVNDLAKDKESGRPLAENVVDEIRAARIVQTALDTYGRIDCVVNNAGVVRDRFIFHHEDEEDGQCPDRASGRVLGQRSRTARLGADFRRAG
jgi:NAD(P)-dependent dehydrogenase (short-subunit alcohol dehydrogenase family)